MVGHQVADDAARTVTFHLVTPDPASELLFSSNGKSWSQLEVQPTGRSDTIAAPFASTGYYLAAKVPTASVGGSSSNTGRIVLIAVITVALALALALVPQLLRRRRR